MIMSEKGSITLFTLIAMMFLLTIAFTAYVSAMTKLQAQNEDLERIKASYEQDLTEEGLRELYNKLTGTREWLPGEGTEQNPYKIYKIEDLVEFSNRTNRAENPDNFNGKYVELMDDVDFNNVKSYEKADRTDFGDINGNGTIEELRTELTTGAGFMPISENRSNPFLGNFLGNSHEIKNIYINISSNSEVQAALFGHAKDVTIKDVGVTGNIRCNTTGGSSSGAGIVGAIYGGKIIGCHNKADLNMPQNSSQMGGIIGVSRAGNETQIIDCYNSGEISGTNYAGGIIGWVVNDLNMQNCNNEGKVKSKEGTGGLISVIAPTATANIVGSNNSGEIIGIGTLTGGIIGISWGKSEIYGSYNSGVISGASSNMLFVGGICGYLRSDTGIIKNCYNSGDVIGTATGTNYGYFGGIAGETNVEVSSCYNKGTIKGKNSNESRMGGITGVNEKNTAKVINCYNLGSIELENETGTGRQIMGGITGYGWPDAGEIKNCYNLGNFKYGNILKDNYKIGGIVGTNEGTSSVNNSYYLNTLTSNILGDGTNNIINSSSKTESEMKTASFITLLDMNNTESVWTGDTRNINNGYPILKWQNE